MSNFNEPWNKYSIPNRNKLLFDRFNHTEKFIINKYGVSKAVIYRWYKILNIPKKRKIIHSKRCIICGEIFVKKINNSLKQFENKKTCSKKCLLKYRSIMLSGNKNPMYGKESKFNGVFITKKKAICKCCGKEFYYYENNKSGKYCSHKCYGKSNRCKNHYRFKGNTSDYRGGVSWKKIRIFVKKRDNFECQKCGMSEDECKLKFKNQGLHVHHLVPYRLTKDNSLSNLVSLCPICHTEEERKLEKLEKNFSVGMCSADELGGD